MIALRALLLLVLTLLVSACATAASEVSVMRMDIARDAAGTPRFSIEKYNGTGEISKWVIARGTLVVYFDRVDSADVQLGEVAVISSTFSQHESSWKVFAAPKRVGNDYHIDFALGVPNTAGQLLHETFKTGNPDLSFAVEANVRAGALDDEALTLRLLWSASKLDD